MCPWFPFITYSTLGWLVLYLAAWNLCTSKFKLTYMLGIALVGLFLEISLTTAVAIFKIQREYTEQKDKK